MKTPSRTHTGFTLIEMMIVVAIVGILMALAAGGYQQIRKAGAAQNAAISLSASLARARARAIDRSTDVWVIIYPTLRKTGGLATNGGNGGWFLYEDKNLTFFGATPAGGRHYSNFDPISGNMWGIGGEGELLEEVWLDDAPGRSIKFGAGAAPAPMPAPFTALAPSACSFCTGDRGAVVFSADGSARFFDAANPVALAGGTAAGRAGALGLICSDPVRKYQFAISGPTSYIATFSPP